VTRLPLQNVIKIGNRNAIKPNPIMCANTGQVLHFLFVVCGPWKKARDVYMWDYGRWEIAHAFFPFKQILGTGEYASS